MVVFVICSVVMSGGGVVGSSGMMAQLACHTVVPQAAGSARRLV